MNIYIKNKSDHLLKTFSEFIKDTFVNNAPIYFFFSKEDTNIENFEKENTVELVLIDKKGKPKNKEYKKYEDFTTNTITDYYYGEINNNEALLTNCEQNKIIANYIQDITYDNIYWSSRKILELCIENKIENLIFNNFFDNSFAALIGFISACDSMKIYVK